MLGVKCDHICCLTKNSPPVVVLGQMTELSLDTATAIVSLSCLEDHVNLGAGPVNDHEFFIGNNIGLETWLND